MRCFSSIATAIAVVALLQGCAQRGTKVVLLPAPDGSVGKIELRGAEGTKLVDHAREETSFDPAKEATSVTDEQVRDRYGAALDAAPPEPDQFTVLFPRDSSRLGADAAPTLGAMVQAIRARPATDVTVIGRTDHFGTSVYNDRLALARAKTVREGLVARGIDAERIEVIALGERRPIAKGRGRERARQNRRVDVIVR